MYTQPEITALEAFDRLERVDFSRFRKYVASKTENFDQAHFVAALSAWLVWIAANRYLPNSRLPLALPVGPVADLHYSLMTFDTIFLKWLYNVGAGTSIDTLSLTDEDRGVYSMYSPLEATVKRIQEAGLPFERVTANWRDNKHLKPKLALVTATREQSYRHEGSWPKIFHSMATR